MTERGMNWIKSAGGPLICVERVLANFWRGAVADTETTKELESDYDRACRIRDYVGTVYMTEGSALILGDMPLETSVWRDASEHTIIVRLFYIDPETNVPQLLAGIGEAAFKDPEESITFRIGSGHMTILDSAALGVDPKKKAIFFEIPIGEYYILTKVINPDSRTSILLHKFCRVM
jgi:Immunity protein 21